MIPIGYFLRIRDSGHFLAASRKLCYPRRKQISGKFDQVTQGPLGHIGTNDLGPNNLSSIPVRRGNSKQV